MDDVDLDILRGEFDERVFECLHRTVHIGFDDDIEFLEVTDSHTTTDLLKTNMFLRTDRLLALELLTFVSDVTCLLLGRQYVELVTCLRCTVETKDRTGLTRVYLIDLLTTLVEHRTDTSVVRSCEHDIAHVERTVLYQEGCYISTSFVQRGLDDRTFRTTFGVCLEVEQLCLQEHFLQELIDAVTFLCGNLLTLVFTTPVLHKDIHVRELLTDLIGVSAGLIDLVDGEDHRHSGSLCMVDSLNGLRHDRIIGSDDDDRYIRHFRTTSTHSGEGGVTRGVEEGNMLTVLELDVVCTDVLGNTSCLTGDDVRVTDVVQERSLTVIDVSHDGDHRATRFEIFVTHHLIGIDLLYHFRRDVLGGETELLGNEVDGLGIETLVDGDEQTE